MSDGQGTADGADTDALLGTEMLDGHGTTIDSGARMVKVA
jgi:hypothetical protein